MTRLTPEQAEDELQAMHIDALTRERMYRYGAQLQRMVEYVIDDTPSPLYPRIRLQAIAAYDDDSERLIGIASTATAEKAMESRRPVARVIYATLYVGCMAPIRLSRTEALALLIEGDLPEDKRPVAPEPVTGDAAFWDSLNRKSPSTAPDGGRPPHTPRRRSTTHLLPALPHAEAVERMKGMYR